MNERTPDWYLAWVRYGWGQYEQGFCGVGYDGSLGYGRTIAELRAYARGMQNPKKYQDVLDPTDPKVNKGKALMGISWDNHKLLPKILDIAKERILMLPFEIQTRGVDSALGFKRNKEVAKMKAAVSPLKDLAPQPMVDNGMQNYQDVDDFVAMGLMVLEEEAKIKDAIDATEYRSGNETIETLIVDDLSELFVAAKEVCVDESGNVYYKYVDPQKLVNRRSVYTDSRDMDYVGYWENMTISQLREVSDFKEDELKDIATRTTKGENFSYEFGGREAHSKAKSYDQTKIKVFKMYWIAAEAEDVMIGYYRKNNSRIYQKAPKGYEERPYSQTKLEKRKEHCVYECSWVVGTDKIFSYGKQKKIVREGNKCQLPVIVFQGNKPSMVERCIPIIDDIQLEMHSIKNTLAKLPPAPRLAYDKALLNMAIDIGGETKNMMQLIQEFFRTGALVVSSKNEFGDPGGSNRPPIMPIELNIAQELATRMQRIEILKNELREISGINEVADGSIKQQDMLVGVMENMEAAATMVLASYVRARKDIMQRSARYAIRKWQMSARDGVEAYSYSSSIPKVTKLDSSISDYNFDVRIVALPTKQEKDFLLQTLFMNKQNGMLDEGDYLLIYNMIQEGDLRKAQFYTVKTIERKRQMAQAEKERAIQMQGQMTAQAGMAVEQEKQKTTAMDAQVKQAEAIAKARADAMLEEIRHKNKMAQISLEQELKKRSEENKV